MAKEPLLFGLPIPTSTANHASTRTAQLYDRRREELNLDEAERIRV